MNQALLVRPREPFADFGGQLERAFRGQPAAQDDAAELVAADELHRDERHAVGFADFVDDGDVGMFDERGGARLAQQPLAPDRVVHEIVGQDLERDLASEVDVHRAIDDPHPAAADFLADLVVRQSPADHRVRQDRVPRKALVGTTGTSGLWNLILVIFIKRSWPTSVHSRDPTNRTYRQALFTASSRPACARSSQRAIFFCASATQPRSMSPSRQRSTKRVY